MFNAVGLERTEMTMKIVKLNCSRLFGQNKNI